MKSIQPLITPTVFKASTLDGSRTSEVSSSSVSNRTFSATVTQQTANPLPAASASSAGSSAQVDAKPISGGSSTNSAAANSTTWTLKLTVDNTQGKSIEVISDRPLPSGTRVELQPVKDHPELLKVVNIKIDGVVLDPMKIDPRTIDPSTTNTNTTTASTVNTLTDASKTASTPLTNKDLATTLKVLADALRQTNLSPIPTPAVKTLLASRLPWLDMGMRALAASTAAAGATQSPPTSSLLSGYSAAQTSLYGGPSQLNKQAQQVQATTQGNVSNTLSGNSATSPIKALPMGSLVTQLQALSSSASNLGASSGANSGTGTLPHSVQQALTDLLSRIPSQNELMRPEGIKNAIQRAPV
ncbi:MAG: hypothetical protein P1U57_08815, partial [Oleibacter sp.]|nr:hypothetical protein [Thalassolituus sp.]